MELTLLRQIILHGFGWQSVVHLGDIGIGGFILCDFSDKGKATMASGGVLIVMYFLNIISSLKDSLVNLKYASFFNYFNASSLMAKNTLSRIFSNCFSRVCHYCIGYRFDLV